MDIQEGVMSPRNDGTGGKCERLLLSTLREYILSYLKQKLLHCTVEFAVYVDVTHMTTGAAETGSGGWNRAAARACSVRRAQR